MEKDPVMELDRQNDERLRAAFGAKYEQERMGIDDLSSYLRPEDMSKEIDGLEARLQSHGQSDELLEKFLVHLEYITTK